MQSILETNGLPKTQKRFIINTIILKKAGVARFFFAYATTDMVKINKTETVFKPYK